MSTSGINNQSATDGLTAFVNFTKDFQDDSTTMALDDMDHILTTVFPAVNTPFIGAATVQTASFISYCILMPIFTLLGITGNCFSFLVFLHRKMRSPTTILLAALAVADTGFLITTVVNKSKCIIGSDISKISYKYNPSIAITLGMIFGRITTWLTTLITMERFIAIRFPLKVKILITMPRMLTAIILTYMLTFGLICINFRVYEYRDVFDLRYNKTVNMLLPTIFYLENTAVIDNYNNTFLTIFFRHIPLIMLIVSNCYILVMLQKRSKWRKQNVKKAVVNRISEEQRRTTITLMMISCIFLLYLLPGNIFIICTQNIPGFNAMGSHKYLFLFIATLSTTLGIFNSSVNFTVYMILNKKFRSAFFEIICQKQQKSNQNTTVTSVASTRNTEI